MNYDVDLRNLRVRRARLGRAIGDAGEMLFLIAAVLLVLLAGFLFVSEVGTMSRLAYISLAVGGICAMAGLWVRYDLRPAAAPKNARTFTDRLQTDLLACLKAPVTPRSLWGDIQQTAEGRFMTNRLSLSPQAVAAMLSENQADAAFYWHRAETLRAADGNTLIHAGHLAEALLTGTDAVKNYLAQENLQAEDVQEVRRWLQRLLDFLAKPKPYFGGIGRDWATGFTPHLQHFSQNLSASVQYGGKHFHFLANVGAVDSIVHNLSLAGGAVALVGPTGVGKSEIVTALAERILQGRDPGLKHYQVFSLNASLILSAESVSKEKLLLTLFGEAVQAGNIILFLDEAQLFFTSGIGAIDLSQILLPILQSRRVKLVAAFTPNDYQRLKMSNEALVNSMAMIALNEPSIEDTFKVVEDAALTLEAKTKVLVTYEAVREAYRLSSQYLSEQAFPGKAITLLNQAVPFATNGVLSEVSVQTALERSLGVKPAKATGAEADVLLNLEERIHERMINQVQAVNAVAAALRRVRAGVTNPNRPAGSFLFLGPTGVGKTELARSLAAAYFGDSSRMVRLDMSEYQRPEDVARLLESGSDSASLILAIRKQPFSVVLLDEIEKAHPNILNLLLQMLDEGQLTDNAGRPASFKSAIIIATSNAGSQDIIQKIAAGEPLDNFERPLVDKLIAAGQFRPELINRFDDVVLFRPLNQGEMAQVAALMISEINKNLSKQNIAVQLTQPAMAALAAAGYDPQFGARPMRHVIQRNVEDVVAVKILRGEAKPGDTIVIDMGDLRLGGG